MSRKSSKHTETPEGIVSCPRRIAAGGVAICVGLAGMLAGNILLAAENDRAEKRPNVLLIVTDQQRGDMLGCEGNRYLETPALDSLAAEGVRFRRAYCANPVCSPSRFSMMSGVMPGRIGMESNKQPTPVPPEILRHAMGTVFRQAGYETVFGGKQHLPAMRNPARPRCKDYGFRYLTADQRDGLAEACADYLRREHDRPFLLVASFVNPHDICYMAINAYCEAKRLPPRYSPPPEALKVLDEALRLPAGVSREEFFQRLCPPLPKNFEIPRGEPTAVRKSDWRPFRAYAQENWTEEQWRLHRWAYARLTERVDAQIGIVLDALREAGLANDTLVVFTSDHGEMDASHRLEHKTMPYEEAIRVPLIVCRKGVTAPGRIDERHLISAGLDLIPTLCDFAGIETPDALKGRSIKPLVEGTADGKWRTNLVVENERSRILLTDRYKYAVYDSGDRRELLFDLEADPGEMRNLARSAEYGDVLARHRALLRQWYEENGETLEPRYIVPARSP